MSKINIIGPVYPICPAFKKNGDINYTQTKKYINYLTQKGARNFIVTAGTSRINLLSNEELEKINKLLCECTNRNHIKIVSNHVYGDLKLTKKFIDNAIKNKADAIIIYFSERYYGHEAFLEYFSQINKFCKNLRFLIHGVKLRNEVKSLSDQVAVSTKLVNDLLKLENFAGFKEEFNDSRLRYELISKYSEKIDIITAGPSMQGFLSYFPFGLKSYLASVGSFNPIIEEKFYSEFIISKNFKKANLILQKYEDFWETDLPEGWHICMKAGLKALNIMDDYERLPMKKVKKSTYKRIKEKIKKIKKFK